MEHVFKKFFSVAALLSIVAVDANNVTPTLALRSQARHADRQKWVEETGQINRYDMESWYGTMDVGVGYMRSFKDQGLASALFGSDLSCGDDCNGGSVLVQGSAVTSRDAKAWLADYLYLNCNYNGSFVVSPRIQNVVIDLDFYLGLDEWANGMYFRMYGPVNWTKWALGFGVAAPESALTTSCSEGYLTPSGDEVLLDGMAKYFAGEAPASVDDVTFYGLRYARMIPNCTEGCNNEAKWGFADLRAELGWNFLQDEDYYLGLNIQAAAPTGTKRDATYVFSPVVGNGKHWELGGGLTGHYMFWRSDDEEKHFGFYLDVNLTHLFNARELRTFDLDGKNNSRYMLAAKYALQTNTTSGLAGNATAVTAGTTASTYVFDNAYSPVANLTTADINVSVGVQADLVAMFNFTAHGFGWDLGYNFWGRSCEKFSSCSVDTCNALSLFNGANKNTWGLKGDARMFGYEATTATARALGATQSLATIHDGTNATSGIGGQNLAVDNAQFATYGAGFATFLTYDESQAASSTTQVKTSINSILLKSEDIALVGTRGISNKVFTNIGYTWDCENWIPYLGIGGSAEFGQAPKCCDSISGSSVSSCSTSGSCNTSCSSDSDCKDCLSVAVSQWSVWVKGGLSFN